jgi:hypothetical protein
VLSGAADARLLEGWPRVRALCPSFDTLALQAPHNEFGTSLPIRTNAPPQSRLSSS